MALQAGASLVEIVAVECSLAVGQLVVVLVVGPGHEAHTQLVAGLRQQQLVVALGQQQSRFHGLEDAG